MAQIEAGKALNVDVALQRILTNAGVPGAGAFNGQAEKGQLCIDTTNAKLYINTGTKASTTWTVVGLQT